MKNNSYKKVFNIALTGAVAASAIVAVAPASANTAFSDVTSTNVHYSDIIKLVEGQHINGFEDGTYRPNVSVTRGQAAKIIANVLGLDTTNVTDKNFKDVPKTNLYFGAISALSNAGIINGFEDNTFRPNDTLTRGQMAKIIAGGFELEANGAANPFTDAEKSIYKDAIVALFANSVTTGKTATTFDPNSPVTRGQLASFVVRADEVKKNKVVSVEDKFTISGIENGKVIIAGEELDVASELASVFSTDNAAALKDAELQLVVEYTTDTVASLTPVAVIGKGKIVGIKSAKFVAPNTKFNAGGVKIPNVTPAAGMTISNVVTDQLIVTGNVTLENVTVATLTVTGTAKITVDAKTAIKKVVLEEGKTLADVIANYNEVKEQFKDVVVETVPVGTTPSAGGSAGGGTGGGAGGGAGGGGAGGNVGGGGDSNGSFTKENLESVLEDAIGKSITRMNAEKQKGKVAYADVNLTTSDNTITFDILDGKGTTPVSTVRTELKDGSKGIGLKTLVDVIGTQNAASIGAFVTKIEVTATEVGTSSTHTLTIDADTFLGGSSTADYNVKNDDDLKISVFSFIDSVLGADGLNLANVQDKYPDTVKLKVYSTLGNITFNIVITD